jgi:hypothetical protein
MAEPDFDFGLGNGRYLKGRGWRGLVALSLFLLGGFAIVSASSSFIAPLRATVMGYFSR